MAEKDRDIMTGVIPSLVIDGAAKAIDTYKKAFGAQEIYRMESPDGKGKIMHASIKIQDTQIFLADTAPEMGCGTPTVSSFYVYFDDVDATFKKAKQAGLEESSPVQDMFWGDRTGSLKDKFGITWTIATHVRDVSPEEIEEAKKNFGKAA